MNPSIFISYRRADTAYASSAIQDFLAARFGSNRVFRDVEGIQAGTSFTQAIADAVSHSSVCLVIIGDDWLTAGDSAGRRRIDDAKDFVRLEIETALARKIPVIPVLVGNARLPRAQDLPPSLRPLSELNAVEIRTGRDFSANIERLMQAIEQFISSPRRDNKVLHDDIRTEPALQPVDPGRSTLRTDAPARSVFISYRRQGGAETARLLRYELLARGWKVFLDVEDLKAGRFDDTLLAAVAGAANFLLILSPDVLASCAKENNWLRKEIRRAIETDRNIVPILKEHTLNPDKENLPEDIEPLKRVNCVDYSHVYYDATIGRLLSFLKSGKA